MIPIGLVGGSKQAYSLPFDAQRTVNLYPVFDQEGKTKSALYGTPGLRLFTNVGTGPVRGEFKATNGRVFVISGSSLYELDASGNGTVRGSLDQSQGIVSIDENGFQLCICDGKSLYIFTYSDNEFEKVTDPDLPDVATVSFIDGYFVANEVDSGRFFLSALYNGLSWNPLDFATAESSPDALLRVINGIGQLWLLGEVTGEIWTNTGDSQFPFERISGSKLEVGISAPYTAIPIDNSLFWVGEDENGTGIVYRTSGLTPRRISTDEVERALQKAPRPLEMRSWAYQMGGHIFYIITGGGLETSWVYDLTTQIWCERAYMNESGQFEPHLGSTCIYAFDKHLVGDRRNGNIYELSDEVYDDNGEPLVAERIYTHTSMNSERFNINRLTIDLEGGVGLEDGSDPMVMMRFSRDGAKTWGNWRTESMGKTGENRRKARFRRLGYAEQMTFNVRITDPVKRALLASYVN